MADFFSNMQWFRTVDCISLNGELAVDIIQTSDKGYAVAADYNKVFG